MKTMRTRAAARAAADGVLAVPAGRSTWLPYHRPSLGEEEVAEVVDTLRSGWITTGEKTRRFEADFAVALGVPAALAVTSGTAALHLAARVLGIGPGDEVVVPTYTFTATAEVVTYLGARPVLCDVDPDTGNVRAADVARVVGPRTRAVMVVHFAGLPCDMEPLLALARARRLAVIEDAAHAFPARWRGRPLGTLGDAGAFSFYATKTITTGEGGMLVCREPSALEQARILALHGISRDAWARYSAAGTWRYEVLANGHKYNLPDLAASLGIHQLRKAEAFRARRRAIAAHYQAAFGRLGAFDLPPDATEPGSEHAWHLYVLRVGDGSGLQRDAVVEALRERNVGTSVHFIPLHLHPYYQRVWGARPGAFPDAEALFERAFSLPIYPAMSDDDVDDVVAAVEDVVRRARR